MATFIQVTTTLPSRQQAAELASQLVDAKLAACAQVAGPITSTYRWQGAVETSEEWLLVAKSVQELWVDLERRIRENHPYEVPEILATLLVAGNQDYLAWLAAEVEPTPDP